MRVLIAALAWVLPALAQYDQVIQRLEQYAEAQRIQKKIPTIGVALVDDQRVVFQRSFGAGDSQTVYRVGSVSKLFTDLAVMQLVEQRKVDLDEPVNRYLPDFRPQNPSNRKITLRLLMSHRSGLVREPPVGHYFDTTHPTLAATVRSLNDTELVYEPGQKTKYSNAGIAVVGLVVERVTGKPFRTVIRESILQPLGMKNSDFLLTPALQPHLAKAVMWTYDGRTFDAPRFELGMAPAGSLYTTLDDLARFMSCLFRGGEPLIKATTLAKMFEPQLGGNYGLGFSIGRLDGLHTVSHGGAIYGFATNLAAIPTEKLGAVVVVNVDSANPVASAISNQALRWMRQARRGTEPDEMETTKPVAVSEALALWGRYGEGEKAFDLTARDEHLYLTPMRGDTRQELRRSEEDLVTDGLLGIGTRFRPLEKGLQNGTELLPKLADFKPAEASLAVRSFLGEYGWDHNVLYVLERANRLFVLIEWFDYYPLTPVKNSVFQFPEWGLYDGEMLTFVAEGVRVGGVLFPKRPAPIDGVFRIQPVRPVEDLRREALAAQPPVERGEFRKADLVELRKLDRTIRLDIRYATRENFLGTQIYRKGRAFLQRAAAEAVVRAHQELAKQGFGLMIFDAHRPWYATKIFWDATPEDKHIFVADPAKGSRHNRGAAVDLTLFDLKTGKAVEMPSGYDEMTERAYPDYPGGTELARWHREVLRQAMQKQGFRVFDVEWWHFDFQDWEKYAISNFRSDQ